MRSDQLLTLAHWLSPAFPTGAFAWSSGLETATAEGAVHDLASLEDWLRTLLDHGALRNDLILLAAAWQSDGDDALADLGELAAALAPSRERRREMLEQGAAFARTIRAAHRFDLPDAPYPVAVGRAARCAGLPLCPVMDLFAQAVLGNLVQAAQRLAPIGQTESAALIARLAPRCARAARAARDAGLDGLGSAAILIDTAAMRHETLSHRIFRS